MHYSDDEPRRPFREDDDEDLVGPRRGGRRPAAPERDDEDLVGPRRAGARPRAAGPEDEPGPRLAAPRLRRGKSGGREGGMSRETVKAIVRDVPSFVKLLAGLARDPRVSTVDKAVVGVVVAYMVTPADLIPDFAVPVLGQLDDVYLLALALSRLLNNAGVEVILDHWDGEMASLEAVLSALDRAGSLLPAPVRAILGRRG